MKHLFCDCKTDEEKANFFLSGRAVETGIIAPAISNDVAMAYHRCDEFKKERDALRAENAALVDDMNLLRDNNTALRADKATLQQMTYSLKDRLDAKGEEK